MNEQQNVRTVQEAYAAFKRGDIQGVLNTLSEDVDWHTPGEGLVPQAGTFHSKQEVANFFQRLDQNAKFTEFEPSSYIAQGDHVVALGHYSGTVPQTGRKFEAEWAMHFTFKGNKVAKFREFTDTAAIAQAYIAKAA